MLKVSLAPRIREKVMGVHLKRSLCVVFLLAGTVMNVKVLI